MPRLHGTPRSGREGERRLMTAPASSSSASASLGLLGPALDVTAADAHDVAH